MKKLIITLSIALAAVLSVHAQDQSPADKAVTLFTTVCNLSPDQTDKIRPMVTSAIDIREANKQKYANDAQGLEKANQANRENLKAQLKTVLTAEQMQKMEDYQQQKKERQQKVNNQ